MPAEPVGEGLGLRIVPPLEDRAWVCVTPELLYGWKLSAEQDRKRAAERGSLPRHQSGDSTHRGDFDP